MSASENPKGKAPLTMKIKFKSANLEQFIERYSVDVSKGGIFIRTKEPQSVGTQLKFEFQLQDGAPLIVGEGTVVWNRAPDPSKPSLAPGMGVRFDKLTPDSQERLDQILSEKTRRGEGGVESRFDAGVRESRGDAAPSQITPTASPASGRNEFGDEPTRAMAADQVNKLAEAMQLGGMIDEDAPTKANPAAVAEALRKKAADTPALVPM
ncbi:MAG TPA: TIGR02266 family protein, partial [Pseudomonadota bacterium]|nr:TIGR02266 family protein [Pseudomonadota bacterium]